MWAGILSLLFCFAMFGGRLIFGGSVDERGRLRVWQMPEFNYAWLKWSVAAFVVGLLMTKAAVINNPTLAAQMIDRGGPMLERVADADASASLAGEIISLCFYALLCACVIMCVDALHHPERGLGRYWPHVSRFLFLAHTYAERRVEAREESEWPSEITVTD